MSVLDVVRECRRVQSEAMEAVLAGARDLLGKTEGVVTTAEFWAHVAALRQRVQMYDDAAFRLKVAERGVNTFKSAEELRKAVKDETGPPVERMRIGAVAVVGGKVLPQAKTEPSVYSLKCDTRRNKETGAMACVRPGGHEGMHQPGPPDPAFVPDPLGDEDGLADAASRAHPFTGDTAWAIPGASLQVSRAGFDLILSTDRLMLTTKQAGELAQSIRVTLENGVERDPSGWKLAAHTQETLDRLRDELAGARLEDTLSRLETILHRHVETRIKELDLVMTRIDARVDKFDEARGDMVKATEEYGQSEAGRKARMAEIEKSYTLMADLLARVGRIESAERVRDVRVGECAKIADRLAVSGGDFAALWRAVERMAEIEKTFKAQEVCWTAVNDAVLRAVQVADGMSERAAALEGRSSAYLEDLIEHGQRLGRLENAGDPRRGPHGGTG